MAVASAGFGAPTRMPPAAIISGAFGSAGDAAARIDIAPELVVCTVQPFTAIGDAVRLRISISPALAEVSVVIVRNSVKITEPFCMNDEVTVVVSLPPLSDAVMTADPSPAPVTLKFAC